jgi:hypothetical protein
MIEQFAKITVMQSLNDSFQYWWVTHQTEKIRQG